MRCVSAEELVKAELGELTVNQVRTVDAHLAACETCAHSRAEIRELESALGRVDTPSQGERFVERVMAARSDTRGLPTRRLGIPIFAAAAVVLLAAGSAMFASGTWKTQDTWTARGSKARARTHVPSCDVLVMRDGKLLPVSGQTLSAADAFAVRYANPTNQTRYLAAFAVDVAGAVHWLFPEYVDAATDPPSIPLASTTDEQLLPQVVAPDGPAPGPMRVVTLMSREPTSVRPIERALRDTPVGVPASRALALAFPHALIQEWSCSWRAR
jgi:hypothetical protein